MSPTTGLVPALGHAPGLDLEDAATDPVLTLAAIAAAGKTGFVKSDIVDLRV